jgi:hypothetical protein
VSPLSRVALTVAATTILSTPAWAEVSDKEASVADIWIYAVSIAALAIIAGAWRRWAGISLWIFGAVLAVAPILEWHDPHVGPAIAREMGTDYGAHAYAALVVAIVLPAAMLMMRRAER